MTPHPRIPRPFLLAILAILLIDRLAYMFLASPLPDEGYYWLWAKHLDWSYFDHPPLQAWLIALSTKLFGHSLFALRAPTLLTTAALVWTIRWWTNRSRGTANEVDFLTALTVAFSIPMVFVLTEITFPDHLLIALLALATIATARTFDAFIETGRIAKTPLYSAALLIGLAGLTKYNAVLFALAVFATILAGKSLRPMLRSVHLYLAALLMLACLTPVFVWNTANAGASFQYNLVDRLQTDGLSLAGWGQNIWMFYRDIFLFAGPFAIIALIRIARPPRKEPRQWLANWHGLAITTIALLAGIAILLSAFTVVYIHWVIIAFIPALPFLARFLQTRWQLYAHLAYGTLLTTIFTINFTVLPVYAPLGTSGYLPGIAQGWPQITGRIAHWQAETGAGFTATSDYRTGSILAFWRNDPDVEVLSTRTSQFTLWIDEPGRAGQNAILLSEPLFPLTDTITERFESIEKLESFPVITHGYTVARYTLYLGRGYIAKPVP